MTYAPLGPSVATNIQLMLDEGETIMGISRRIGVSRDRIRTVIRKYKLDKPDKYSLRTRSEVTGWVEKLIKGQTYAELSDEVGLSREKIRNYLEHYGFSTKEIKKLKSEHKHDGRKFGYWTVLPGSHTNKNNNAVLTCECICGEIRQVSLSNLIGGCSKSCGCKGYAERTTYPWRCVETGEVIPSTKALAEKLGLNPLWVYRQLNKEITVIESGEHHWECLEYAAIQGTNVARAYLNEETGEVRIGAKSMGVLCDAPEHHVNYHARTHGHVVATDGSVWKAIES